MKKILIAGGTGLIGQRLIALLPKDQYHIHILTRSDRSNTDQVSYFQWDLEKQEIDQEAVDVDVIINLTGAGIADSRWTASRKRVLIESRTKSAALIKRGIEKLGKNVSQYIGASAIGYYGDRGNETLNETSLHGRGFLSECCVAWEDSHRLLEGLVDQLALVRIGIVLSMEGGALPKMLMTRKVGVFNYFGDGKQYYSWIHIDDLALIFKHIIDNKLEGIYNGVAPDPMTNKTMMQAIIDDTKLSGILIPAPAFALKLAMGEMAAVVLDSSKVTCEKIVESGYEFSFDTVGNAVSNLLA